MAYKPTTVYKKIIPSSEAHTFDVGAFDDAVSSQGVTLVHWRAMACPQGKIHRDDNTRTFHEDHANCSHGFLYRKRGTVDALFTGNSQGPSLSDLGAIDGSTVQATFRRTYNEDNAPVYVGWRDRFYLADDSVLWQNWETVEFNGTGQDRLRFPAVEVQDLIDSRMEVYVQGVDFEVRNGRIIWGDRNPGVDLETGRGRVYTAWYLYKPYWYVERIGHEARITQAEDEDGNRKVVRMPFAATLTRESVFESDARNQDPASPEKDRENQSDRSGSFGPF